MKHYIMFDVGGTGIKYGNMDEDGNLISDISSIPSPSKKDKEEIVSLFADIIKKECDVCGIGMAWPGPFDYKKGVSLMDGLGKYQAIYGINIGEEISRKVGWSGLNLVYLNDVAAFTNGYAFENKIESEKIIALVIGTGAGSAFYNNGKCVGSEYNGVPNNGWIYNMPFRSEYIEDWVSSKGIKNLSQKYYGMEIDGKTLFELAERKDEKALKLWLEFGDIIKEAMIPFIESYKPDSLVLGGKISKAWKYFTPVLLPEFKRMGVKTCVADETSKYVFSGLYKLLGDRNG